METKKPHRMTVKQAVEEFFENTISEGMIYSLIKKGEIPYVELSSGKKLLDWEQLELWWNNKLTQSVQPKQVLQENRIPGYGTLRKIAE